MFCVPVLVVPAQAQWAVFDAANYAQNLLEAARALQQINNQIQQLQNEATMMREHGPEPDVAQYLATRHDGLGADPDQHV